MQVITLIQSAQGQISNAENLIGRIGDQLRITMKCLEEAQTILRSMPEGKWNE